MPVLTLPDGKQLQFAHPVTGLDVATIIGTGLAKAAVCITVNGQDQDLSTPIIADAQVQIQTLKTERGLDAARHTLVAQVLARAVQELYPHAKLAIGPTIDTGGYYDVDFGDQPLSSDDLPKIEQRMREIIKEGNTIQREERPIADMRDIFKNEPYKLEIIADVEAKGLLLDGKNLSVYRQSINNKADFMDLCVGPHAPHLHLLPEFKLTSLAGAYWRGDANNQQLTRIYLVAFPTKAEVDAYLTMMEEAKLRDHRKLGRELDIFELKPEEIGSGLPLWLPNGTVLRKELEMLALEEERKDGYHQVATPLIAKEALYHQSGHLPYYEDDMYAAIVIDDERYRLKPMNCPHHHHCYSARPKSYRDLPYRIAEYGTMHRYEAHGALSGLMRVRGMCLNDAHIYCRFDQAKDEFIKVMHLHARYYRLFGISDQDFRMRLSKPDMTKLNKYVNQPEKWTAALELVQQAMQESGLNYYEGDGEAAFYGPKIDFQIKSVIGQEYTVSTNQLDFLATQNFNLTYQGEDGKDHPLYVIHRAPLSTHERFIAFLLEHYAGKFPTWLAPVQLMVIPITDAQIPYAQQVRDQLFNAKIHTATGGLRVETDFASERMQKKILVAQQKKIPYMLVVGKQEAENGTVAIRLRDGTDLGQHPLPWLLERLQTEITTRTDLPATVVSTAA